jgi:hypothetical protein
MALINVVFRLGPSQSDPISRGLSIFITWSGTNLDQAFWSQQLSFWFIGVLVFISLRGLLINLIRVS